MTTLIIEGDRKREAANGIPAFALTTFDRVPGTHGDPTIGRHDLAAVHYDTDSLTLINPGITPRHREGGDADGGYLTVPRAGHPAGATAAL